MCLCPSVQAYHRGFHPNWGQLFKAGHQNSRWAQQVSRKRELMHTHELSMLLICVSHPLCLMCSHQVQEYACLYTSHATNFLFRSANFRALEDLMVTIESCISRTMQYAARHFLYAMPFESHAQPHDR